MSTTARSTRRLPKGVNPDALTLEQALEALKSKAAGVVPGGRLLGEHPEGGPINVLAGRFGPYVKWGKVNATIPKSKSPETITLEEAVELIADREGRPAKPARKSRAGQKGAPPKQRRQRRRLPRPSPRAKGRGAA